MGENKVSNSKLAYYEADGEVKLLTIEDAVEMIENGINLRNCLYDVEAFNSGSRVPLKLVTSTKRASYFATKAVTTAKRGSSCSGYKGENTLHESAKVFLANFRGTKLLFDEFVVGGEFITDIETEYALEFSNIRPDVLIKTTFMNFFVEITVTHGLSAEKLDAYKAYRSVDGLEMPFVVVEIDLSDLQEVVKNEGYNKVRSEVESRLVYNSEFKKVYTLLDFNRGSHPFGVCRRSGLPYKLIVNNHADAVDNRLREVISNTSISNYIKLDFFPTENEDGSRTSGVDELHSLFLTDGSVEGSLYPLDCPIHKEYPLRLTMQAEGKSRGCIFLKCDLYTSKSSRLRGTNIDESLCDVTMDLCSRTGKIAPEFLCAGSFFDFVKGDLDALERVHMCALSYFKYCKA